MLSTPTLHPFLSHFPTALFVAGMVLLFIGKKRDNSKLIQAASLNLSLGLLMGVLAALSGMFAADIGLWPTPKIEGHQGYSFAFVALYVITIVYSYTKTFSQMAIIFYVLNFVLMCATAWSGYLLVFHSKG